MIVEQWRPVQFAPGYEVSDLGRVRSWRPWGGRGKLICTEPRIKSQRKDRNGYFRVTLIVNGKLQDHWVARLVTRVFVGEPPAGKPMACHCDGNKENNVSTNLRWGSARDNAEDTVRHGHSLTGSKNGSSKLSERDVEEAMRMISGGATHQSVADLFGVHQTTISRIVSGVLWKHLARAGA